ncbi:dynactin subunit 1-like isoform X2 [Biomphalaria glabrata]|nr:dynactin subunit 1-like isoform X2 [Biomphalaria glabrata]XP_055894584.1 dynactin subunit 1-like isoform X2 [Biomphalaria glabrata]XP_055894592.1 dynactin subunit 1-like isoform X2 [Biomphalaria glabrata]XP_055894599.1 dynactin subunit 1-like isoform X2 [Biomphalaria glabrata]
MATTQPVASVKVGTRVEIIGKGIVGTVAYIGNTVFSPGKWVGVVLDEPKGKNNGTVQGKTYFACQENYGVFVRQSQVAPLENQEPVKESPPVLVPATPRQSGLKAPSRPVSTPAATPATAKKSGLRPPGTMTKSTESLGETPAPAAPVKQEPDATPASRLSRLPRTSKESTPADDKTSAAAPETTVTAPVRVEHAKVEKVEMTASSDNLAAPSPQASLMNLSQLSAMSSSQSSIDERFSSVQQQQEIEGLKLEVKDLNEKLETLKIKRAEDKVKLKEFEKTKIQLQQLQEYKSRMQESHADLQRQLQASKKELSELQQEYESYKEEMADVTETVEMATLDKEMAEEKAESLQAELDSMKEKVEELTLDLELIRNEISSKGSEGVAATFELKQMEQQNERMKDALVKLRDMLNSEKQDRQRSDKMVEKLESELAVLRKDKERLQAQVTVYEKELIDLKEQVDAALGAEEMVETLTERNLKLEDEIKEILEEKNDLEALNDMNEELQENAKATELELREEVDMKNIKLLEIQRKLDATQETFADYDRTLNKFRELVAHLQEQLRSKQQESETKVETPTAELMDFKTKFAETKAYAKTIDMELRRVDIHQANSHIKMLLSFMPDAFMGRGGDHDAICILLMVPRIMNKAELLASQVKDKYEIADKLEREHVLKSHKAEQFSFANHLNLLLNILYGIMKQYESALNSCSTDLFLKIGTLLPEMTAHEKSVDYFIDLLRKDQLDETVSVDLLEKSISFFQQLYTVHLSHERVDCTHMMSSDVRIVLSACDAIATEITRLKILLLPGEEQSNFSILLKDLETCNNDTRTCARKIKRRLPQEGSAATTPLKFGKDIQDLLTDCCKQISNVAKLLKIVAAGATQQVALMTGGKLWELEKLVETDLKKDKEGLIPKKMEELAQQAAHDIYSKENTDAYESLRLSFGIIVGTMNKLANAMENGEYDFDGTHEKKKPAPLKQRAEAIKSQASDIEAVKLKVDAKEEEIKELKRQLRLKQEELSEQQVRIGLVEKKLENKNKEAEEDLSKLQRKLDESALVLKKKEKEFEETYDTLQSDIDSLEQEKTELKERLRVLSKNTLLQNMSRQSSVAVSGSVSPVGGPVSPDSNLLVQQVAALRDALHHSKQELIHLKAERMKKQMASLTPLDVPKKPCSLSSSTGLVKIGDIPDTSSCDLNKLIQRTKDLLQNANKLSACPRLIDISSRMPGCAPATQNSGPMRQIISQTAELTALERNTQELQVQMTTVLASSRSGGQVRTDFSTFPTPQFAKMLHEKTNHNVKLGTIQIPTTGKADIIPLHLQPDQFRYIHEKLIM